LASNLMKQSIKLWIKCIRTIESMLWKGEMAFLSLCLIPSRNWMIKLSWSSSLGSWSLFTTSIT
jgi:hypothetical protein